MRTQRWTSVVILLLALLVINGPALVRGDDGKAAANVRIQLADGQFEIRGLAEETLAALRSADWNIPKWQKAFSVGVHPGDDNAANNLPPMLGSYSIDGKVLRFRPRYALRPGLRYRAVLKLDQLPHARGETLSSDFSIAAAEPTEQPPTEVVAVYPSSAVLPENQLKFYIQFSAPMQRAMSYPHLRLRTESGKEIEYPFLELPEELWDPERTRFTLFFDPGRIKRGLKPREQFGPALEEGERYVLEIDAQWRDAHGRPLRDTYRKAFAVVGPDDLQPDPKKWQLTAPATADAPLAVQFDEPLDRGMIARVLHIENADGKRVAGTISIADEERSWSFHPDAPWQSGSYALVVATNLEDRAGNSIARPFEVDLFERVEQRVETPTVRLPFDIKLPR